MDRTPSVVPLEAALGALLPPGAVGVVWATGGQGALDADERLDDDLPPEELEAIRNAVPSRRKEFARGRACAREALRRLGGVPEPIVIPVGPSRAPVWPAGVTGSITHCAGLVAVVVARVGALASIGVDAEPAKPLPPGVRGLVLTPTERTRHAPDDPMETIVFSAKEAIHKAIHPATGAWLDFQDVELTFHRDELALDVDGGGFLAEVVGDPLVARPKLDVSLGDLVGRYALTGGFVLTVAHVPRASDPSD